MSIRVKKAVESFKYLWRLDDSAWVDQRKREWKVLQATSYSDCSRDELKMFANYFVYGEYESRQYMPGTNMYTLTPHSTVKQVREIFNSDFLELREKSSLLSLSSIFGRFKKIHEVTWAKTHTLNVLNGLCGPSYHKIELTEEGPRKRTVEISENPTRIGFSYLSAAIKFIDGRETYHPVLDFYDYFMSALPYANDTEVQEQMVESELFDILFEVIYECIESNDGSQAYEFSKKLLADKSKVVSIWDSAT